MAYEKVAEGGLIDAAELSSCEDYLAEGQMGLLEIDLRLPVSESVASELQSQLTQRGMPNVKVTTASPMLKVYFRKGFPWLAVIAAAILGLIVLAVLIIGWRLFREIVPASLQSIVGTLIILAAVTAVGLILWRRRR